MTTEDQKFTNGSAKSAYDQRKYSVNAAQIV